VSELEKKLRERGEKSEPAVHPRTDEQAKNEYAMTQYLNAKKYQALCDRLKVQLDDKSKEVQKKDDELAKYKERLRKLEAENVIIRELLNKDGHRHVHPSHPLKPTTSEVNQLKDEVEEADLRNTNNNHSS
jgi:flagellar motility protein MotE (MotC chaperone)